MGTRCACGRRQDRLLRAGTSGRLGVLDAVECPPTFGVSPDRVVGLIAGGEHAFVRAVEGAEDSLTLCAEELDALHLGPHDLPIGIAASGRTPYVIGGLRHAHELGCRTVAIACNKGSDIGKCADLAIEPCCGPEVLTGSTRLKAGTAQKMILNMISTGAMVGCGKAYENLMVDVQQSNEKLEVRAQNIVMAATGADRTEAERALQEAGGSAKCAIVSICEVRGLGCFGRRGEAQARCLRRQGPPGSQGELNMAYGGWQMGAVRSAKQDKEEQ
jgi:N-acetylmuramic acid 6-phosphate etherase